MQGERKGVDTEIQAKIPLPSFKCKRDSQGVGGQSGQVVTKDALYVFFFFFGRIVR